jgi:hypothetical protein
VSTKKKWTRRSFIESTFVTSVTSRAGLATVSSVVPTAGRSQEELPELPGFDRAQRLDFISMIDEIIPAADGMPAASEVDIDRYVATLFTRDQGLIEAFESGLDFLREKAMEQYEQSFSNLDSDQRIELLEQLEVTDPVSFRRVREAVYEGYYTRPQIWHLVGYQPHPTNSEGPVMEPFDESSLERVRRSPKLYRDV